MPIPQLKRRSYGFTNRQAERQTRTYGETKERFDIFARRKKRSDDFKWLLPVLLSPFRIIFWIFRFIWRVAITVLGARPRLSKEVKRVFFRWLFWLALTAVVFVLISGTALVAWVSRDLPDPDKLTDRQVAQSTKIYDRTGTVLLYEVFASEKRTFVELNQIPKYLIDAVLATEDTEFYQHKGIRLMSFVRALVYGMFTNKRIGGTSTLTQQLVKNAILTDERTLTRKIKEIILSLRLEQKYSKEQILKIYFNEIPYGSTNYGVEAAAQSYFGKHVSEATLSESAVLAGLPKAPSKYLNNPEAMKNRRDFVLERMFEEGYITKEEKEKAQAEPLVIKRRFDEIKAPHFVLHVKEKLVEMYGEQVVDSGGLKVITTLDWGKQDKAEKAIKNSEKLLDEAKANNAALVAIDPQTGQILAMVGSRDFFNEKIDGQFNVATLGRRQPGSSFKPIVYAAAFEKGYTPDTILWDVKINFAVSGEPYEPRNYDEKERGPVTMRQALQGSLNIPAVQTLHLVGSEKGVEFAERMGYTTLSRGGFGLSLVLGGGEVKLLEHTNAYAVFANNGEKFEPAGILKVEDAKGETLFEWKNQSGKKVLNEKIAATISNVLSDDVGRAFIFGAGGVLTLKDRPVAVKTGTTNNYVDAWTVGYTPSLVAGVWVGNTDNKPMRKGDGGSRLAAPIWNQFMSQALAGTPAELFPEPAMNEAEKPILRGSLGGQVNLEINRLTGKIAVSSTPAELIEERTYMPAHSILHYVNKDDPRGPMPEHPEDDPQYEIWEAAIQSWIDGQKEKDLTWDMIFQEPPAEYDNITSPDLAPVLEVISPIPSSTLNSRQIKVEIKASAPRGVSRVIYQIDDKTISTSSQYPFSLDYEASGLSNGAHKLTVVTEDDAGNSAIREVDFVFQVE